MECINGVARQSHHYLVYALHSQPDGTGVNCVYIEVPARSFYPGRIGVGGLSVCRYVCVVKNTAVYYLTIQKAP